MAAPQDADRGDGFENDPTSLFQYIQTKDDQFPLGSEESAPVMMSDTVDPYLMRRNRRRARAGLPPLT